MMRLDQWDKAWDNFHDFDGGDGATPEESEDPLYRVTKLPHTLSQIFVEVSSCSCCSSELVAFSDKLLGICLSCDKKRQESLGNPEDKERPIVSLVIRGIDVLGACSNVWGAGLKYKEHEMLIIGRNAKFEHERELLAYALSAALVALKKACRVELIYSSAPKFPSKLTRNGSVPSIDGSILPLRIAIAAKRHHLTVVSPDSTYERRSYYNRVREDIMLQGATMAVDHISLTRK